MSEIIVLGSLNADLVARVERAPEAGETVHGEDFAVFPGGKGANQAYAAARLGGKVAMIGRVGADAYGRDQVANLRSAGVAAECVRALAGVPTGTAFIVVEGTGENRIVVIPGANGAFATGELQRDLEPFALARFALFQLETPLETVRLGLEEARRRDIVTILDPAPAQRLPAEMLRQVDYLTPNLSELRLLSGGELSQRSDNEAIAQAARSLLAAGVGTVIAKLGPRGALLVGREGTLLLPGWPAEAVDTTAAGDCFNAAFAVALARGESQRAAGNFACAAAACSVTRRGAQSSMPTLEETLRFMEKRKG